MQQLQFVNVHPSDQGFPTALQILWASFPLLETRTHSEQVAVAAHSDYNLCLVWDGDLPVGVVGFWQTDKMLYLENFCVAPSLRNGGYGSRIVRQLAEMAADKIFLLEAELPTDQLTSRRIAFYCRNGMVTNTFPHIQAHLRATDPDLPLVVLSFGRPLTKKQYAYFRKYLDDNVDVR